MPGIPRTFARAAFVVVVTALAGCAAPTGPERELSGERLYKQYCARCHGEDGKGVAEVPGVRDLSDPRIMSNLPNTRIKQVVRMGLPPKMPAFGDRFTDAALEVLVAHVRSLSGTSGEHVRRLDDGR